MDANTSINRAKEAFAAAVYEKIRGRRLLFRGEDKELEAESGKRKEPPMFESKKHLEGHTAILRELTEARWELTTLTRMISESASELVELRNQLNAANACIVEMKEKLAVLETTTKSSHEFLDWRPNQNIIVNGINFCA